MCRSLHLLNTTKVRTSGSILIGATVLLSLLPFSVLAQAPHVSNLLPADAKLEVFPLQQISAESATQALQNLVSGWPEVRWSFDGANRMIVFGSSEQIEKIRAALEVLDVAPAAPQYQIFRLKNLTTPAATQVLISLGLSGKITFASDERTNSLILRGPADQLSIVQSLLTNLDRTTGVELSPKRNGKRYRVDVAWLMEGPSDGPIALKEPISALARAIGEIEGQGFLEVLQAGQLSVAVRTDREFQTQGTNTLGRIEVQGGLRSAHDGKLELELSIWVYRDDQPIVSMSTEILTEPGHDVVLGIAGSLIGHEQRRSAFVVRVNE